MIAVLITVIAFYLGLNAWLLRSLWQALHSWPLSLRIALAILYVLVTLSFFLMQALRHRDLPYGIGHALYWTANSWLFVTLFWAFFFLCALGLQKAGWHPLPPVWSSLLLTVVLLGAGFVHFCHTEVRQLPLKLSRPLESRSGLRIVGVSDLHLGYGITRSRLRGYVEAINAQKPDIVLISGDLIDMAVEPLLKERMQEELARLKAPQGIYMVPGNHEYISGIKASEDFIKQTPIVLLRDSVVTLPCGITLIGRDDHSNPHRLPVAALMKQAPADRPVIVLDHQPHDEEVAKMVEAGADMAFFGHTHHGQIIPIKWVTDAIYRHSYGYAHEGRTHIYVSSGLGLWGPPFRIGTDCELVVMDIAAS